MSRRLKLIFTAPFLILVIVACNLTSPRGPLSSASPTPDLVQTITALAPTQAAVNPTAEVIIPTAFPTAVPTVAAVVPTKTSAPVIPTAVPTKTGVPVVQITPIYVPPTTKPPTPAPSDLTRINFAANATSNILTGNLNIGQTKRYVLRILGGQVMMVDVDSPNQDVFLRIYGLSTGQILLDAGMGAAQSSWQGRLPSTQDYVIETIARGDATTFTLNIIIPENIFFQPGAISASRSYPIRARETHTFMLRATAGQTMTLKITPTDQSVLLAFYGYQDGQPYLRSVMGQTSWTGQVPATQDYVIQAVSVVDNNTNFTLDVKIQ